MAGQSRRFTQEFKDTAVRMVLDGPRPVSHVAQELGIHDTTLGNWVREYRRRHGEGAVAAASVRESVGEKKSERELRLERENRKLREENEFLKKAAAFSRRNTGDRQVRVHRRGEGQPRHRGHVRVAARVPIGILRAPAEGEALARQRPCVSEQDWPSASVMDSVFGSADSKVGGDG